jgi:lipopolysaccharide transport system permease protein
MKPIMNSKKISLNPIDIIRRLWSHRELIQQFTKREILMRYRGSYLGMIWTFVNPLLMLVIYTFVFSVVFNAKWGLENQSKTEFAMVLFCGLIGFNIFAEVISRAPSLILNNTNYVKKVVFPLEILPIVAIGSSLFHFLISFVVLLSGLILLLGVFHWTLIFLPLVLLPLLLLSLGLGWILSSLGVFLRDIGQFIGIFVTAVMFLSPIFYPISSIPKELQYLYLFNPISYIVEDMRRIIIWGQYPNWNWLIWGSLIGITLSFIGYIWFQKTKKAFPDVM